MGGAFRSHIISLAIQAGDYRPGEHTERPPLSEEEIAEQILNKEFNEIKKECIRHNYFNLTREDFEPDESGDKLFKMYSDWLIKIKENRKLLIEQNMQPFLLQLIYHPWETVEKVTREDFKDEEYWQFFLEWKTKNKHFFTNE